MKAATGQGARSPDPPSASADNRGVEFEERSQGPGPCSDDAETNDAPLPAASEIANIAPRETVAPPPAGEGRNRTAKESRPRVKRKREETSVQSRIEVNVDELLPPLKEHEVADFPEPAAYLPYAATRHLTRAAVDELLEVHPVFVAKEARGYRIRGGYLSFVIWRDWHDFHREPIPPLKVTLKSASSAFDPRSQILLDILLFPILFQFGKSWKKACFDLFEAIPRRGGVTLEEFCKALGFSPNAVRYRARRKPK